SMHEANVIPIFLRPMKGVAKRFAKSPMDSGAAQLKEIRRSRKVEERRRSRVPKEAAQGEPHRNHRHEGQERAPAKSGSCKPSVEIKGPHSRANGCFWAPFPAGEFPEERASQKQQGGDQNFDRWLAPSLHCEGYLRASSLARAKSRLSSISWRVG